MAGLVPAIHVFSGRCRQDGDGRNKSGHDELHAERSIQQVSYFFVIL
jgi:hypothetical protein